MVKRFEAKPRSTGGTPITLDMARAYLPQLQPFFRSAVVKVWPRGDGTCHIYVDWEWSSGLSNFVLHTVEEVEMCLAAERRGE